ncbi:MAG: CRISPR-associated DxTHG motif protein [Oscillospiraceae bacterium]|nr:CRISPR-associated DxTHG motif protein [Oscillospiraceae bacterium]
MIVTQLSHGIRFLPILFSRLSSPALTACGL